MVFLVAIVVAVVVGVWFFLVQKRGKDFVRSVALTTEVYLRDDKEPGHAIRNFLGSVEFKRVATADVGKRIVSLSADLDRSIYEAAYMAAERYRSRKEFWRNTPH